MHWRDSDTLGHWVLPATLVKKTPSSEATRSVGESPKYHGTHNKDREDKDNDKYME